jgi:hypothetical protein
MEMDPETMTGAPLAGPRSAPGPEASMAELVARLAEESRRYVELQIELTKMQALQGLAGGLYDGAKIAVAAALFGLAGLCLVIALALGLSVWMGSYWMGVLATGLLLLIAACVAAWFAIATSFLLNVIPKDLLRQVRILSRGRRE